MSAAPPSTPKASAQPLYTGVILAAGQAARMGTPKLLLPLEGRPLLLRALEAVEASSLAEIVLVVSPEVDAALGSALREGTKPRHVVVNPDPHAGQSCSLQQGLAATGPGATAAAVVLGDTPGLNPATIDRVARAFENGAKPCARPVYCSPPEPPVPGHPVFVARRLWPDIDELRGDQGLRELLARRPEWLFRVETRDPGPSDIDTLQDYEAISGQRPSSN